MASNLAGMASNLIQKRNNTNQHTLLRRPNPYLGPTPAHPVSTSSKGLLFLAPTTDMLTILSGCALVFQDTSPAKTPEKSPNVS